MNSYGMFHPSAPNLRRSWMTAWKKARPKSSGFHAPAFGPSTPSKNSGSEIGSVRYEPSRLALNPFGGSLVILTPSWSTETGKWVDGADVSHRRKSAWARSGERSSQIFSSVGIHETARWQFWSTTQPPICSASEISRCAIGPCPWPSEIACVRLPPKPRPSANFNSCAIGSWPGESTKISGDVGLESA